MFFIRLLRWLMGWVRFEAEGGFPERLLNLAAQEHLRLWSTYRRGISLSACCLARRYRHLRPLARKAGVRMRVQERRGVPFFLRRYHARLGVLVGLTVYIALLQLLSQRIWVVEVHGCQTLSPTAVQNMLEPMGVRQGAKAEDLDLNTIQLTAIERLPELSWLAVNLQGSVAQVELVERRPTPELADPQRPSNLKASRDGRVVSVEVLGGQAEVQVGDAVAQGHLLVSGVVESKVGPILRRARGKILAETSRLLEVRVPLQETQKLPGPISIIQPTLQLFGLYIPLYTDGVPAGECRIETFDHPLTASGRALPLGIRNRCYTPLVETLLQRTEAQAAALAETQLAAREREELQDASIQKQTRTGGLEGQEYVLRGTYVCVENIAVEEPMNIE